MEMIVFHGFVMIGQLLLAKWARDEGRTGLSIFCACFVIFEIFNMMVAMYSLNK